MHEMAHVRWRGAWSRRLTLTLLPWSLLITAGTWVGPALAAGALPQRNLVVSWRLNSTAESRYDAQGVRDGAVVVDTQGGWRGRGTFEWGTQQASDGRQSQMQVMVLNGASARLSLGQQRPYTQWQWLVGLPSATPGMPGLPGGGQGSASPTTPGSVQALGQTTWVESGQGLRVKPSWPGGRGSVSVEFEAQSDTADASRGLISDPNLPPTRMQAQTTVLVPLDQWVPVAQTARRQEERQTKGVWHTGQVAQEGNTVLEIKVSLP